MSEFATPDVLENHADIPQVDTSKFETILADFRTWLQQADQQASPVDDPVERAEAPLDLHALAGHFIALRHEVNLQTKAVRAQQEQSGQALEKLGQALEVAQQTQKRYRDLEGKDQDDQLRPLVKSLLDAYDGLALAKRQVERARPEMPTSAPAAEIRLPFLARLVGCRRLVEQALRDQEREQAAKTAANNEQSQRLLESIVTGYTMSLQRLERTLTNLNLEAIATVGQAFDPEKMEVVEVVADPDRAHMEVVDEVRRGYMWRGRVFRFAQVRVAKN